MNITGFDNKLLDSLKKKQTAPYAKNFEFRVFHYDETQESDTKKIVYNTQNIRNFETDFKKVETFLIQHCGEGSNARVSEIVFHRNRAYVLVHSDDSHSYSDYILQLNADNTITVEYLTSVFYSPVFDYPEDFPQYYPEDFLED